MSEQLSSSHASSAYFPELFRETYHVPCGRDYRVIEMAREPSGICPDGEVSRFPRLAGLRIADAEDYDPPDRQGGYNVMGLTNDEVRALNESLGDPPGFDPEDILSVIDAAGMTEYYDSANDFQEKPEKSKPSPIMDTGKQQRTAACETISVEEVQTTRASGLPYVGYVEYPKTIPYKDTERDDQIVSGIASTWPMWVRNVGLRDLLVIPTPNVLRHLEMHAVKTAYTTNREGSQLDLTPFSDDVRKKFGTHHISLPKRKPPGIKLLKMPQEITDQVNAWLDKLPAVPEVMIQGHEALD